MVCSRSLAVTLKKSTLTQRSIDNSLKRFDTATGEAFSLTSRCADMDAELSLHLGVPKAILDNVIFCHQEESNWPLSESGVLKKKFDDIFSSKRFAVALEEIKAVRKTAAEDVKIGNVRLVSLKEDTQKAKRVRADIAKLNQKAAEQLNTLDLLESKITQAHKDVAHLNDVLRQVNLTADQIQQMINKRDFYQTTINSLEDTISERPETTEELKEMLHNHQKNEGRVSEEKNQMVEKRIKTERKQKAAQEELSKKHTYMGKLMASKELLEEQIQRRSELIDSINSTHSLSLPSQDGTKAVLSLKKYISELDAKLRKEKSAASSHQNMLSDDLQVLKSRHMSIVESKKHLERQIKGDKEQIELLKTKLLEFNVSTVTIDDAKELRALKELDEKVTDLNDEMNKLSKHSDFSAKLSLKKTEVEKKRARVNELYNEHIKHIEKLINKQPAAQDVEKELLQFKRDKEKNIEVLSDASNKANKELSIAEGKIGVAEHHVAVRKKDIEKYQIAIKAACGDGDLMETLNTVEKTIVDLREQLANIHGAELIYGKFFEKAKSSKCCPLCTRGFSENSQNEAFQGKLETIMQRIPNQRVKLNEKLKQNEEKKTKLRSAQGDWIKLESLRKDVASIEKNLVDFEIEKDGASNRADVASVELIEIESYTRNVSKLLKPAEEMARLFKEAELLAKETLALEDELSYTGFTRTLADCQQDMEELSLKRVGIDMQLKDYEENLKAHTEELKKVADDIIPLEIQVQDSTEAYEQTVDRWKMTEENFHNERNGYTRHIDRLEEFNRRISREEASSGSAKFESAMKEVTRLETFIETAQKEARSLVDQINLIEKDETERRTIERDLQDQITYRDRLIDLKTCEDELKELKGKQGSIDLSNLSERLQNAKDNETNCIDQRGSVRGSLIQIRDQVKRYEEEMNNDYAGVDTRYAELFLDVKAKEIGIADLDKCSLTLQAAIVKYHSLKMQELNKMIHELWMNTYQGGDIDRIEIRADAEGTTASRTINYRVMMIKNNAELNMRGRCSAGQKVLASIIIRLALAETFCVDCGVFTLDEPTTNLDRDNIESLAHSIAKLIERKRLQRNFQFVIITHDEEFVECLSRCDALGQYYRVKKNERYTNIVLKPKLLNKPLFCLF
ncbi:hypothetical protein BY458DRAFT_430486 [Sporodiniella umbellata]|nr:hypothetical protein BY458DRAFT_430486 [Sporodiniella umbellata]